MRILDRYILNSVLAVFLGCLVTFLSLYIIADVFTHLEDILKQGINLHTLSQYYFSYLPLIFVQVTPIACLLSVLYTFSNLNRSNEIIAMRSSGLSIFGITKTVLIFGFIVSMLVFWVNDKLVPRSLALNLRIKDQIETGSKKINENEMISSLSMYGMKNRLYFVNRFYPHKSTMENIVILEHDERQNITKKIVANKGIYSDGTWKFYQSITYNFDENGQVLKEPQYAEEEIMMIPERPRDFLEQRQQPDLMTIAQLDNYLWRLSKSGAVTAIRNFKVDLYRKFTEPFTSVIIILMGIPFSLMMKKRTAGAASLGIAIMLCFLYYVLGAVSTALGKAGILTPVIAVSLSHVTVILYSLYMIHSLP